MISTGKALACSLAVAVLCGCASVTTQQPLSLDPKPIDREKWEAAWLSDKNPFSVRFSSNGVARIAWFEWKDDQFVPAYGEMIIAEGEDDNYLSIRFAEDGAWSNEYLFAQYAFSEAGDLIVWAPVVDRFKEAIQSNRLEGTDSNMITSPPEKIIAFMDDPENGGLFDYKNPLILRRIVAFETPSPPEPKQEDKPASKPDNK